MRMNPFQGTGFLGVAMGERAITVAEVCEVRGGRQVRRLATYTLPEDASAAQASAGLASFLKREGFSSSRAVLGMPAKWVVCRERDLPPAGPEQARDVLRMQAERQFSSELRELVFDYAGTPDPQRAVKVMLLAMPRDQLERAVDMAETAGLDVVAATPAMLALADAAGAPTGLMVNLGTEAVELSLAAAGQATLLRHLPVRGPQLTSQNGTREASLAALGSEIRRAAAMMGGTDRLARPEVTLWDGVGMNAEEARALGEQTGLTIKHCNDLSTLGVVVAARPAGATDRPPHFAAAVALALAGGRAMAVDFLHPKLAAPPRHRLGRRSAWALALVAAAVLLGGLLIWETRQRRAGLAELKSRLVQMDPQIRTAEAMAAQIGMARGWFEAKPPTLECLREVTMAFRDDERIYVTNFSLNDSRKGQLHGRSSDQKNVLSVRDRLMNNKEFEDVKLREMRDAGGNSREVSFSLSFTYIGVD